MPKNDVLAILESVMTDPGSIKSGEYLEEHTLAYARNFLSTDRLGLIEALCQWIRLKNEPRTMLAVRLARELELREARQDIEVLRQEVAGGMVFPRFYLRDLDEAISRLMQE